MTDRQMSFNHLMSPAFANGVWQKIWYKRIDIYEICISSGLKVMTQFILLISYCTCVFLVTWPFSWFHNFDLLTLNFDLLLTNFNLGCYLMMVPPGERCFLLTTLHKEYFKVQGHRNLGNKLWHNMKCLVIENLCACEKQIF